MAAIKKILHSCGIKKVKTAMLFGLFLGVVATPASAHLMVAQHGTVNIVGTGGFLVISLPVSAFANVDDDGDKKLSRAEFTKHRPALITTVNEKMRLLEKNDPRPLEGMMLSPVSPHDNPMAPVEQIVIMGRFSLTGSAVENLNFQLELFGQQPEEQKQKISFSYKAKSLKHKVVLTPKLTQAEMFPAKLSTTNDTANIATNSDNSNKLGQQ